MSSEHQGLKSLYNGTFLIVFIDHSEDTELIYISHTLTFMPTVKSKLNCNRKTPDPGYFSRVGSVSGFILEGPDPGFFFWKAGYGLGLFPKVGSLIP